MSDHDSAIISVSELRETLARTLAYAGVLTTMLDELAQLRAKERLRADSTPAVDTDDLPPDAATGLYLDRPFDADDLEWLRWRGMHSEIIGKRRAWRDQRSSCSSSRRSDATIARRASSCAS